MQNETIKTILKKKKKKKAIHSESYSCLEINVDFVYIICHSNYY